MDSPFPPPTTTSSSPPLRPVIICADDYGLAPGVGVAIRALIAAERISATSCMTVCPFWPEEAALLKPLAAGADIGLHLTLTDQAPLGPMPRTAPDGRLPSLPRLMGLAFTGTLDRAEITAETERQVAAFVAAFGAAPAFIDGHQHVHQLPGVRDAALAAAARLPGCYLRLCREPLSAILRRRVAVPKAWLLSVLGRPLARAARAAGVPANTSFRGVHDFTAVPPFSQRMARFLDRPGERALVMVHPGLPDEALRRADPLVEPRAWEFEYLAGAGFSELLARLAIRPARFRAFPSQAKAR